MDDQANESTGTAADSARKDWVRPALVYFEASYASMAPEPNHDGEEGFDFAS